MKRSVRLSLGIAGSCSLFAASVFVNTPALIAQSKSANTLSLERISQEPDAPVAADSVAPAEQTNTLRWSSDASQLAWMHLVIPPVNARDKSLQREIWTVRNELATAHDSQPGKPFLLLSAATVTTSLRGSSPAVAQKFSDDDDNTNPYLLTNFAWFPKSSSSSNTLLLIGTSRLAAFDTASGKSITLVSGEQPLSDAAVSPDGRLVSFIRNHSLWQVGATGGAVRAITPQARDGILQGEPDWPYRNELQMPHAYWWSPDSSHVAWLETNDREVSKYSLRASDGSSREIVYPKPGGELPVVRVLVKSVDSGSPVAIELPPYPNAAKDKKSPDQHLEREFYLPHVQWLPDGRHLAIERIDRRQHILDLFLADIQTGKSRLILTEKDSYWINLPNDLFFLKDGNRFICSSERSGFRHLYLYNLNGNQLAQLTKGDWEVTRLDAVDQVQGRIYFTATEKSPLERHLYQVNLDGSDLKRVSNQPGTHTALFASDAMHFADTYSSLTEQPSLTLHHTGEVSETNSPSQSIAIDNQPIPAGLQPVELLKVKLHMGTEVNALMIRPPSFDATKKYPVIVYMAGGPGEQLVRNAWGGATGLWMQFMAQKGYLVFALDNHGTAGQGHFFEEPLHLRFSAQELIDQRDGVLYLKSLPYVDSIRMGACGWGYGGFLVTHAMLDRPIVFRAGFAGAAVTDWHFYDAVFAERYLDDPVAHADGWDASTALENARYFKSKLLLAQGTDDEFVHMENLLTLQDKLVDAGKSADTLLLPDRGHSPQDRQTRIVIFTTMTDFFVKSL